MKMGTTMQGNSISIINDDTENTTQNHHDNHQHIIEEEENYHQTYAYSQNIQGGATPPVEDNANPSTENSRNYSRLKVRILLPVIGALYFSNATIKSLLLQYLLDRWSLEAGHNTTVSSKDFCDRNETDPAVIEADAIQSKVSYAAMYLSWCSCGPALLSCLVFGALVDLIGRKPALVLSQLGTTLQIILIILVLRFHLSTNLLYIAFILDGLGGSFMVFLVANLSATADVSDNKKSRIAWIVIVLTLSRLFNSGTDIAVGIVIKKVGFVAAALTFLIPTVLGLFLTVFLLPETLPLQSQGLSLKKFWDHICRTVFLYSRDGNKRTRCSLFLSLMIFFTASFNDLTLSSIDTLYQKHEPLCWDSILIGYYVAFRSAVSGIFALVILWFTRYTGCVSDEVNAMISVLFLVGGLTMEAFVKNKWEMFIVPLIRIPGSNVVPITRGVMSFLAGPEKQGVLFSSIAFVEVFCLLFSATAYSKVYAVTVAFMPGTVYLVMAGATFVTFLIYIPFFHFYERPPKTRR